MLFKCVLFVRVHFGYFPVSIPIPFCVSRCPSFPPSFPSRLAALVFLFPNFDHVIWRRSFLLSLPRNHPKCFTSSKFSSLPSAFPFRPFVFPLPIMCSCESGGIYPVVLFSFPCPVWEQSGKEWEPFFRCFSNFWSCFRLLSHSRDKFSLFF